MTSERQEQLKQIVAQVHCPSCGRPAAYVGMKWHMNQLWVVPWYSCDTDDWEFRLEGPKAWTPDSRD